MRRRLLACKEGCNQCRIFRKLALQIFYEEGNSVLSFLCHNQGQFYTYVKLNDLCSVRYGIFAIDKKKTVDGTLMAHLQDENHLNANVR